MPSTAKRVLLAAPRGYCAGVDRAVVTVEKALGSMGRRSMSASRSSTTSTSSARWSAGGRDLRRGDRRGARGRHGYLLRARCGARGSRGGACAQLEVHRRHLPAVTKVHREAVRFADADYDILLIGHEGHESSAPPARRRNTSRLVDGPDDVEHITVRDPDKVVWLSQTTLSVDETMETVRRLRDRFPSLQDPPSDDICYATQNRQLAVKQMAPECDLMIVVGSRNSSNSVRLVEVALEHGAAAGYLVDYASEIEDGWFEGVTTVGVTSGASVPEILVREVLDDLAEHPWVPRRPAGRRGPGVARVRPAHGDPPDLKAAGMSDKMTHDGSYSDPGAGSLH